MSIRLKITAWFGALIALTAILSYILVFSVSNNVMLKNLQDLLAAEVEDNVDEIEFFYSMSEVAKDLVEMAWSSRESTTINPLPTFSLSAERRASLWAFLF